jgi:hypothetical protein
VLLSSLLAWTLVAFDRHRVTRRAAALVTALLLVPPLIWPDLLPVPFFPGADRWFDRPWIASGITSLVGGGVGAVLGAWVSWALRPHNRAGEVGTARSQLASGTAFMGLALGWQAVVGVLLLALAIRLPVAAFSRWKRRPVPPLTAALLAAFVLHHVGWRWSTYALSPWWPGLMTSAAGWGAVGLVFGVLLLANRLFRTRPVSSPVPTRTEDLPGEGISTAPAPSVNTGSLLEFDREVHSPSLSLTSNYEERHHE